MCNILTAYYNFIPVFYCFSYKNWENNRNFFDFLRHGEETRFSNFRLGQFWEVEAKSGWNDTPDKIDRVSTSDNSTPSGAN